MVADALVEQQRRGIDDVRRLQPVQLLQGFVVQLVLGQPAAVQQPQIVPHQRRPGGVLKRRERGQDQGRLARTAQGHEIPRGRVRQGHGLGQAIEDVGADGRQLVLGPQGGDFGLGGVIELLPGQPLFDGGFDLGHGGLAATWRVSAVRRRLAAATTAAMASIKTRKRFADISVYSYTRPAAATQLV